MTKLATVFCLAFLCGAAHAQPYALKYTAPTQQRLAITFSNGIKNYWQRPYSGRLDMNADGVDDLVMVRKDPQGTPIEMIVFDMVTRAQIWNWADDNGVPAAFMGFADIDGDGGLREPVFILGGDGEDHVTILEPKGKIVEFERSGVLMALIADLDADGLHELIINKVGGGTEVWGTGAAGRSRR